MPIRITRYSFQAVRVRDGWATGPGNGIAVGLVDVIDVNIFRTVREAKWPRLQLAHEGRGHKKPDSLPVNDPTGARTPKTPHPSLPPRPPGPPSQLSPQRGEGAEGGRGREGKDAVIYRCFNALTPDTTDALTCLVWSTAEILSDSRLVALVDNPDSIAAAKCIPVIERPADEDLDLISDLNIKQFLALELQYHFVARQLDICAVRP